MTSAAQVKANQRNGKKSKGPTSDAGKAISSQNAVIHGALSDRLLLPNEDIDAIAALEQSIYEVYQPRDAVEHALLERIILGYIRQQRLERAENAKIKLSMTSERLAIEINQLLNPPFNQRITAEDISENTEMNYQCYLRALREFNGINLKADQHDLPALEAFNLDEKDLLARIAEEVTELVQLEELRLAHERCEQLSNDEKVALWSLLDSRTRSALKKYKTEE